MRDAREGQRKVEGLAIVVQTYRSTPQNSITGIAGRPYRAWQKYWTIHGGGEREREVLPDLVLPDPATRGCERLARIGRGGTTRRTGEQKEVLTDLR